MIATEKQEGAIAMACPVAAITIGAGKLKTRTDNSNPAVSMPSPAAGSPEANTLSSNPALSTRELPARTTAFTVPAAISDSAWSSPALMAASMSGGTGH